MAIQTDRILQYDMPSVFIPDGNLTNPGLYFAKETRTGVYRPGAGQLGIDVLGVQVAKFTSSAFTTTVVYLSPDGTVAAPGFAFTGQPGTGIYRIGSANMGFTLNGIKTLDLSATTTIFTQASADTDGYDLNIYKTRGTVLSPTVITTGDQLGQLNFGGYSGAGGYVVGAAIRGISAGTIATTRVAGILSFLTGTDAAPTVLTERMRIDQNGNIGINYGTMLGWAVSGTYRGIQNGAYGGFLGNSATTDVAYTQNAYYDGTNWKYSSTAVAGLITQAGGVFTYYNAASGTAGNTITLSQVFGTDTTNRFMVGTGPARGQAGDLTISRTGATTTGLIAYGSTSGAYIYYDGTNFVFSRDAGSATLSSNGVITTSSEFQPDGSLRKRHLSYINPDHAMATLLKVRPRIYDMVDGSNSIPVAGFFAENLHEADSILGDGKNYFDMHMMAYNTAAIQNLHTRIEILERKLASYA